MTPTTKGESARRQSRVNIRGAISRAKLLDAALEAFATRGFHGTSTRDIAEAAGMSPAAVYAHYRSKEDLLFLLSRAGHSDVRDVVFEAGASSADPVEQLRTIASNFASWHARFHTHARVVQYEYAALSTEHSKVIAELRRQIQTCLSLVIDRGVAASLFDVDDARGAARAILSLGIDVARWYDPAGHLSPNDIGEKYGELALRMVTKTRARPQQAAVSVP